MDFNNSRQRKWKCFVCGIEFLEYYPMKDHIIEEHEEGKQFIICPLKACSAPVRDMRSHFKAKHPQLKTPKIGPMRCTEWYDFVSNRSNKKKFKTKKPAFKDGYMTSMKNNGAQMHYRSSYEKIVYECLEEMDNIISWNVEPFSVPYYLKGKKKNYWPDLIVKYDTGDVQIWEIKPYNQTELAINKAKWEACHMHCLNRGWKFKVKTEKGINELIQEAKKLN